MLGVGGFGAVIRSVQRSRHCGNGRVVVMKVQRVDNDRRHQGASRSHGQGNHRLRDHKVKVGPVLHSYTVTVISHWLQQMHLIYHLRIMRKGDAVRTNRSSVSSATTSSNCNSSVCGCCTPVLVGDHNTLVDCGVDAITTHFI